MKDWLKKCLRAECHGKHGNRNLGEIRTGSVEAQRKLGGVAYARSRDASNLPLGQVQAGVARTQAALQSLTQLAKSVKSR